MSAFVLDCSIAVAWLFDDEATPETDAVAGPTEGTTVRSFPVLWHPSRSAMSLARAERHKRVSGAQIAAHLELLGRLPIRDRRRNATSRVSGDSGRSRERKRLTTCGCGVPGACHAAWNCVGDTDKALVQAASYLDVETLSVQDRST